MRERWTELGCFAPQGVPGQKFGVKGGADMLTAGLEVALRWMECVPGATVPGQTEITESQAPCLHSAWGHRSHCGLGTAPAQLLYTQPHSNGTCSAPGMLTGAEDTVAGPGFVALLHWLSHSLFLSSPSRRSCTSKHAARENLTLPASTLLAATQEGDMKSDYQIQRINKFLKMYYCKRHIANNSS